MVSALRHHRSRNVSPVFRRPNAEPGALSLQRLPPGDNFGGLYRAAALLRSMLASYCLFGCYCAPYLVPTSPTSSSCRKDCLCSLTSVQAVSIPNRSSRCARDSTESLNQGSCREPVEMAWLILGKASYGFVRSPLNRTATLVSP